jgi:CubicO group peptidase (beta-lactamase class C family)
MGVMVMMAAAALANAPVVTTLDGRTLTPAAVTAEVERWRTAAKVPGLGVAIVEDGRVVLVEGFGQREVAKDLPVTPYSVFAGASLTKAAFAYMVMQLVDEGKIDLDTPIARYLPKPLPAYEPYAALVDDPRWQALTFRTLLAHTTGFANFAWLEPDEKLRIHWQPGTRYGYSGEGINLAQFVLEQGMGLDVGAEMQRRVFTPLGMTRTSMTWRDDFETNFVAGYDADGKRLGHKVRQRVRAAGSMDTTPADYARFLAAVSTGKGLSPAARAEMVKTQITIDSEVQFPTLDPRRTDRWRGIGLGYGLGWGRFDTRWGPAIFKEGHDDVAANYSICVDAKGGTRCVLLMANSLNAEAIFAPLVDYLLGPVGLPVEWEVFPPAPVLKD